MFSCLTTSRAASGAPVNQLFPNEGLVLGEGPNQRGKGAGPRGYLGRCRWIVFTVGAQI